MGRTHSLTGVATWLFVEPAVDRWVTPMSGREIVASTLVVAGAAMWPDLDHPSGTFARSFGPVTRLASRAVVLLFGPHRHGTHSYAFAALAAAGGVAAGLAGGWWAFWPVFLAVTLSFGVLFPKRGLRNEIVGFLVAAAVYGGEVGTAWLGIALGLGCLAHVLGDRLTPEGQALYWPVDRRLRPGLGYFTTNTPREHRLAAALVPTCLLLACAAAYGWAPVGAFLYDLTYVAVDSIGARA